MGVCAAGKTEWEGRVGIVGGNLIKRLCTAANRSCWYIQKGNDPSLLDTESLKRTADGIYGEVAYTFLIIVLGSIVGRSYEFLRLVHDQQRCLVHGV